jgi:hypothetical protein
MVEFTRAPWINVIANPAFGFRLAAPPPGLIVSDRRVSGDDAHSLTVSIDTAIRLMALWRGHQRKFSYHRDMTTQYPAIGSKWKERDVRVARTVQIIRYDVAKRRVRIACLETDRLTWAKLERFNGKSGGYAPY